MTPQAFSIVISIVGFLFVILLGIIGWFVRSSWTDLRSSIQEIKAQLTMLAEQKDIEKLQAKSDDHHDRIVKLEAKVGACKHCNG